MKNFTKMCLNSQCSHRQSRMCGVFLNSWQKKTRLPEHWWLNQPAKVGVEQICWQYSKWVWSQFTVNVIWSKLLTLRHILTIQQTYIYIALIFFFLVIRFKHSPHIHTDWLRPELKTEWAFHVSFECMYHFGGRLDS